MDPWKEFLNNIPKQFGKDSAYEDSLVLSGLLESALSQSTLLKNEDGERQFHTAMENAVSDWIDTNKSGTADPVDALAFSLAAMSIQEPWSAWMSVSNNVSKQGRPDWAAVNDAFSSTYNLVAPRLSDYETRFAAESPGSLPQDGMVGVETKPLPIKVQALAEAARKFQLNPANVYLVLLAKKKSEPEKGGFGVVIQFPSQTNAPNDGKAFIQGISFDVNVQDLKDATRTYDGVRYPIHVLVSLHELETQKNALDFYKEFLDAWNDNVDLDSISTTMNAQPLQKVKLEDDLDSSPSPLRQIQPQDATSKVNIEQPAASELVLATVKTEVEEQQQQAQDVSNGNPESSASEVAPDLWPTQQQQRGAASTVWSDQLPATVKTEDGKQTTSPQDNVNPGQQGPTIPSKGAQGDDSITQQPPTSLLDEYNKFEQGKKISKRGKEMNLEPADLKQWFNQNVNSEYNIQSNSKPRINSFIRTYLSGLTGGTFGSVVNGQLDDIAVADVQKLFNSFGLGYDDTLGRLNNIERAKELQVKPPPIILPSTSSQLSFDYEIVGPDGNNYYSDNDDDESEIPPSFF